MSKFFDDKSTRVPYVMTSILRSWSTVINLACPDITEREIELVLEVLQSNQLGLGPKMVQFEENMASYVGTKYAVACNSGTSGLHMLIRAMDIQDGDEVITTPFSFIASSNCILFERATPVFADIDPDTYNIDPNLIEEKITDKTKAILPVHVFGQSANMDAIRTIANKHGLRVIEDACEAIGARWNGKMVGSLGDAGVFAFYPNKQMTTGEGGIVVTDDEDLAMLCRSLRNQGRGEAGAWMNHVRLGFNYRLDELSCALGVAQLERIETILDLRSKVAQSYMDKLKDVPHVNIQAIHPLAKMSWFVFVVRFDPVINRDLVMSELLSQGIGCRAYFEPIHLQPFYKNAFSFKLGDYPVTEQIASGTLAIPFYNHIAEEEVQEVVDKIHSAVLSQITKVFS